MDPDNEIGIGREDIIEGIRGAIQSYCEGDVRAIRDFLSDMRFDSSADKVSILYEAISRELFGFVPNANAGYPRTVDVIERMNMITRGVAIS